MILASPDPTALFFLCSLSPSQFDLTNIPPAPRGAPQIEVTFQVDADGIMKVSAADKGTGKSESITISNDAARLSPSEIERMIRDAEKFELQDVAIRRRVESTNNLQSFISSLKSQITDNEGLGGKLDSEDKETIHSALRETEDWLDQNVGDQVEAEDVDDQLNELQASVGAITSKLYGTSEGGDLHFGHGDEL